MFQAYIVYHLLALFLILAWYPAMTGSQVAPSRAAQNTLFASIISILIFTFTLGLRDNVGGDFEGYVYYFLNVDNQTSYSDVPYEIGFFWLVKALRLVDLNVTFLFLATCAFQIIFIVSWLKKHRFVAPWFFLMYFLSLHAFEGLNIVRQEMSFTVLLASIPALISRRLSQYMLLVSFATLFHTSAAIFFPLYFVLHKETPLPAWSQLGLLLLVTASAGPLATELFNFLPELALFFQVSRFESVQEDLFFSEDGGLSFGFAFFFTLITDAILILTSSRLIRKYSHVGFSSYYNLFLIGALLNPVVLETNYIVFARLNYFFLSFKLVCFSFLLASLFSKNPIYKIGPILAVLLIMPYYAWFLMAISKGAASSAPFNFVFD